MKFLRKGKRLLKEPEAHALTRLVDACKNDSSGAKARYITYCLLNEAVLYTDLNKFSLTSGFKALYAHLYPNDPCVAIDKVQPSGVK